MAMFCWLYRWLSKHVRRERETMDIELGDGNEHARSHWHRVAGLGHEWPISKN